MTDGERAARQYDAMASDYAADNVTNSFNDQYERPAMIALLGNVKARKVLEVGCRAGPLTRWLVEHEAIMTATDVSSKMLRLAKLAV